MYQARSVFAVAFFSGWPGELDKRATHPDEFPFVNMLFSPGREANVRTMKCSWNGTYFFFVLFPRVLTTPKCPLVQ